MRPFALSLNPAEPPAAIAGEIFGLAARFHDFIGVVSGTTLGMMLANIPVIYLGHRFADRLPAKAVHVVAALIFVLLAGLALRNAISGASLVL